jgi:hypothetical protein
MTNLPDAVESVPQEIGAELEELTVTQNGTYTPQEGVDGFSKVVAEFDTSSLPKARMVLLRINNNCIDDNGQWIGGEFVDFSAVTSMQNFARYCRVVKNFDNVSWNFSPNTGYWDYAFNQCDELTNLDFTKANKTKVTNIWSAFASLRALTRLEGLDKLDTSECGDFAGVIQGLPICEEVDITSWDFISASRIVNMFQDCYILKSFIGNKTIADVLRDNIKAFTNAKIAISIGKSNAIERPSLRALINGIADLTGQDTKTITLGNTLMAKLTEEDIAIAVSKNWTIV